MTKTKKRKLSIKKISKFLIILTILTIIICNIENIKIISLSKMTGYNKETIEVFMENNTYDNIKKHKYSKTLEKIINTNQYNKEYTTEYLDITYIENDYFLNNINKLLEKGYTANDINKINNSLTTESINLLINNDYIKDITNFLSITYFKENNLERYIKYYNSKEDLTIETIITHVNIGIDNEHYTNVINIENENNIEVLVNKYHKLPENYEPSDLENISSKYGNGKLKKEAKIAFEEMCEAAKKENIKIYSGSAYRSYEYQLNLYNRYVAKDGDPAITDTYSARAGYSEHQTGLAIDILNAKWDYIDKTDKEFTWLQNNSYKYGFILRYPENKENITGYMYEPWHFRYLGINIATEIVEKKLTYDEYIAKK